MALKAIKAWVVTINGNATIEAVSGDDALVKARKHFKPLDTDVTWGLTEITVYVDAPEPPPV